MLLTPIDIWRATLHIPINKDIPHLDGEEEYVQVNKLPNNLSLLRLQEFSGDSTSVRLCTLMGHLILMILML